ncbi:hypothetical protein ACFL6C_02695 [Myxococcota bacterium]
MANNKNGKQVKDVFVIRDGKNGDSFWTRIGCAFVNVDGSLNVVLDALPAIDGKLHIRDRKERQAE